MDINNKRSLSETSPEDFHLTNRKRIMSQNDVFSWDTFDAKMERMMVNVAKKEDLLELQVTTSIK